MGTTEWVIAGVGAAALVSGVVFNIGARSQMSDCRSMARANNIVGARDACDRASPFAYTSYALLGGTAAAAIADAILIWTKPAPALGVEAKGPRLRQQLEERRNARRLQVQTHDVGTHRVDRVEVLEVGLEERW